MLFSHFCNILDKIENISGRNEMTESLAAALKEFKNKDDARYALYFMQGRLAPKFTNLEFNFSSKMMLRAMETTYGPVVKELMGKLGDIGKLAEELKGGKYEKIENESLLQETNHKSQITNHKGVYEIVDIFNSLKDIAITEGKGSQEIKIEKFKYLFETISPKEAKYVTRIIVGELRLGLSDKTILDAFSWFIKGDKSVRSLLDMAFGYRADIGDLASMIVSEKDPEEALRKITIEPGTPIASKLVEREDSSESVWERMPNCYVQPKLDGLRGQIHYQVKGRGIKDEALDPNPSTLNLQPEAMIFSRNMESLTDQFPEITESVKKLGVDSIILDSEIIGFNEATQSYMSYQDTMKRRRKNDISEYAQSIPVKAMCFDILYLNGEDLTQMPLEQRLEKLFKILEKKTPALTLLETAQMHSVEELDKYFKEKIYSGLEGIITKQVGTNYEPGTRNFKWIKLKANTQTDLVDTIDVAILGYYYGQGNRAKFGFGALLAGVYDPESDSYFSIGKVGTGFKDIDYEKMLGDMTSLKSSEKPENYVVDKTLAPDVWIKPGIVSEIVADEITRSPNHTTAVGVPAKVKNDDSTKGLSIRFPRMKIWKRDKDLPNNVSEIVRMYELRKGK